MIDHVAIDMLIWLGAVIFLLLVVQKSLSALSILKRINTKILFPSELIKKNESKPVFVKTDVRRLGALSRLIYINGFVCTASAVFPCREGGQIILAFNRLPIKKISEYNDDEAALTADIKKHAKEAEEAIFFRIKQLRKLIQWIAVMPEKKDELIKKFQKNKKICGSTECYMGLIRGKRSKQQFQDLKKICCSVLDYPEYSQNMSETVLLGLKNLLHFGKKPIILNTVQDLHAEMEIVNYMRANSLSAQEISMGISKLPCKDCATNLVRAGFQMGEDYEGVHEGRYPYIDFEQAFFLIYGENSKNVVLYPKVLEHLKSGCCVSVPSKNQAHPSSADPSPERTDKKSQGHVSSLIIRTPLLHPSGFKKSVFQGRAYRFSRKL